MADDFTNKFLKSYGYDVNSLINPKPITPTVDILKTASDMQAGVSRQINQIMQTQQQLEQKQQKLAEFQQKKELEVQSIADFNNYKDGLNKSIGQLEADIGRPLNDTERLSTYTAYHKALISNLKGAGRDDLANQAQVRYNPKVLFSADQDKIIAQAEAAKKEAEAKKFGVGKFIKDVGVEAVAGLADLGVSSLDFTAGAGVEAIGKLTGIEALQGLGGKAHSLIDDARKAGLSEYSLQNKRDQQAAMAEAEKNDDYLGQALSYLEDPASIVGNLIGSLGGAGLAGKGAVKIAGKLAPTIAESVAEKAGVVGFGAITSGGSVKQSQRETAVQDALAAGYSQEDAQAIGERAAELNVQQLLGAAIGGVAGSSGLEKVFSKAGMGGKTVLGGALKGAAEEGIPEIAQGAQEQYAANAASIDQGVLSEDQAMRGVIGAGLGGGLIGGLAGGGIGAGVGAKNKYLGAPTDGASAQPAELTPSERVDLRTSFAKSGFNNKIKAKAAEFGLTPEDFVKSVGIAVDSGNGKTVVSTDTTPEVTTQTVENSAAPKEFKSASDALASIKSIRVQNPEAFQEFAPTIDAISSQTEAAKQFLTAAMRGGKSSVHFDSGHVESKINEINALNKLSNDTLQAMNKRLDVLKDIGDVGGQDAQGSAAQVQSQPKAMVDSIEPIAQEQAAETRISDQELKSASNEQLANLLSEALDKNQIVDTQKAQAQIKNLLNVESKPLSQKDLDDSRKVASTLLRNKGNPNYAPDNVGVPAQAGNIGNNIKAKRVVDYVPSTAKTNVDNLVMSVVRYKGKNGTLIKNFDETASAFPYSVLTKDGTQIDISSEEVGSGNNVKIGVIGVVSSDGGMLYVDGRQEPITFSDDRSVVTKTKGEKARLYLEEYVVDAVKIAKQNNTGIESEDISDDLSIAIDDAKEAMDSLSDEKNEIPSLKDNPADEAPKMSDKDIASTLVDWFTDSLDNVADAEAQLNALERALKKETKGIKGEKEREAATSDFFIRVLTPWLDDPTKPLKLEQKVSNDEQRRNNQDAVQPESRPTENTKGGTTVPESTGGSSETNLESLSNEKLANLLRKAVDDGEILSTATARTHANTLTKGDSDRTSGIALQNARDRAIGLLRNKITPEPQNVAPAQQELNIETPEGEANQAATEPVQDSVQETVKSKVTADERAKLSDADVARLEAARTKLEAAEKKVAESKGDERIKAASKRNAAAAEVKTIVAKAAAKGITAKKAPVKKAPAKKENTATLDKNETVETTAKAKAAAKPKQTIAETMKNFAAASKRSSASKVTQNKSEEKANTDQAKLQEKPEPIKTDLNTPEAIKNLTDTYNSLSEEEQAAINEARIKENDIIYSNDEDGIAQKKARGNTTFLQEKVTKELFEPTEVTENTSLLKRIIVKFADGIRNSKKAISGILLTAAMQVGFISNDVEAKTVVLDTIVQNEQITDDANVVNAFVQKNGDNNGKKYIIADKKAGVMYVMNENGTVAAKTPALFGKDVGDDAVDGQTPAGRFNLTLTQTKAGDSYGGNVQAFKKGSKNDLYAIHRVYTGDASEARVQRLNSSTAADNRVSHGCINVPADFYDKYLNGYFSGAAYVIPETSSVKDMFPSGVQFSKSKNPSAKGQVSDVQKALVEMFGSKATFEQVLKNVDVEQSVTPEMVKSFEAGNLDAINSNAGEKLSKYDDVQGYFNPKTGRITLIADNLPDAKTARAVFLHEVGHKQLPKMLGDKYSKFSDRIKAWDKAKAGSVEAKIYEKAKARADQSGETGSRYDDELIAYAIEESELAGVKVNPAVFDDKSAKGFLASVWRTMTNAMKKIFPSFKGYLTANDLVSLAYGAADLEIKNTDYVTDAKEEAIQFSMNLTLEAIPPKVKTSITEQAKKKVIASKQAGKDWIDRTSAVVSKGDGMTTLQKVSRLSSGVRRFGESYIFNAVDMDSLTDWTKREFIGDDGQTIMGDAVRAIKTSGAEFRSAMADFQNEVGKPMFEADIKEQHPELTKLWSRATDVQYDPSGIFKSKKTSDTELDALYKALTPRAKVVYKNTMIAFSKQFDRKVKAFEKSLKASGFTDEEIAQIIGDIERLYVYMPRKQFGEYIISAYVKNEDGSNGEALAHEFFDGGFSGLMEDRIGKQLREKFGNDINVTKQKPLVERLRPSLSASQADVLAAHEARLKNSGLSADEVKSQIDEFVKTLAGFGIGKLEQTQEQRTGVYSSGFERDQIRAIFDVASSNEQLIAKFNNQAIIEKHLKAMDEHIDKNENKEGYDYLSARMAAKAVRDSYNYVQSNDIGQTLVSKVNALGFLTTMGFDMSQVPLQLSSLYNLALPHFVTRFSKDKKFATKQLGSNFYAALKMVRYGGTQEYLDALKVKASNGDKEAQAIIDKIEPAFMQLRANDRVSFTDLKDVENEIYGRSGIMQSIMKWSGTHLNVTEQVVNLSIAMTAIELAKKNGMNQSQIDAQVDEALRRGNPNSTPTTKGLYSKTAIGRWLTMMRSYSMAVASRLMSDLRTLIALRKNRTDPDYIESRNRLVTTVVFQATMAGVVNVPTFMTAPIWAVLWAAKAMTADDEDDELTTDQWTRKIVEQTIGEDMTRLLRFGALSIVGGDSLAKRMSFSDLVIKSANDDVNRDGVKDFFDELYANAPMTIGVTKRTQVAMSTFFDEITNPNIDKSESFSKLLTKSLPMKSVNSIAKGYESIKNDGQVYTADSTPLLEDSEKLNWFEIAAQILGIRPAGVVKAQDDRWALMSTKIDKENMQKSVRNSYKIAYANFIQGDATQEDVDAAKMVIDEFNKKYPLYAITDKALASARSRMDDNIGEILYSPINAKDAAKVEEITDRMPWLDREED